MIWWFLLLQRSRSGVRAKPVILCRVGMPSAKSHPPPGLILQVLLVVRPRSATDLTVFRGCPTLASSPSNTSSTLKTLADSLGCSSPHRAHAGVHLLAASPYFLWKLQMVMVVVGIPAGREARAPLCRPPFLPPPVGAEVLTAATVAMVVGVAAAAIHALSAAVATAWKLPVRLLPVIAVTIDAGRQRTKTRFITSSIDAADANRRISNANSASLSSPMLDSARNASSFCSSGGS